MSDLFLRACRGEKVERAPIWIMRQAGRYLPEYREVRKEADFITLCKTPELAAKVTMQPIDRFGLDAAILFSDILTPAEPMGFGLEFNPGPVIDPPVRCAADVERIRLTDPREGLPYVFETIRILRRELEGKAPLIGFAAAPFTLATYLVEGSGSKNFDQIKRLIFGDPATAQKLLDKVSEMTIAYLSAQIEAGAQAVQLFDTWGGLLAPPEFEEFALRHARRVIDGLADAGVPRIYFALNGGHLLEQIRQCGAEVVGQDWRMPLHEASRGLGDRFVLQGNLDPCVLFASKEVVEREALRVLDEGSKIPGHIFNLGHGVLPKTPVENVEALIRTVPGELPRLMAKVAVIGGGVSGLATAFEILERAEQVPGGIEVRCYEGSRKAGGNIETARVEGFLCEWGPTGFLDNAPATLDLVERLGLTDRIVRANSDAEKRFIFRNGKLRSVPTKPPAFLASDILSFGGKLRMFGEPFAARRPDGDESVFDFAARRIGPEAAAVLVDAMVAGIYAGDARQLSLAATFPKMHKMESDHGSLFRAMLAKMKQARAAGTKAGGPAGPGGRLTSFRDGLQELIDALVERVGDSLVLDAPIRSISYLGDRGYRIHPEEGAPHEVDAVVLSTPAWKAAEVVGELDPEIATPMSEIPSAPLAVVHFGYSLGALGDLPDGFGFLVPRNQGPRILGTLWPSCIFPDRAPDGRRLFTVMIGGAHEPRVLDNGDTKIADLARADLQLTMGIIARPYFTRVIRHPRGIPQYTLGHLDRVAAIEAGVARYPGLAVCGNSYRGISVNLCVEEAPAVAEDVISHLTRR